MEAQQDLGPQALLARLLNALDLPPSARLCFPAVMPVEIPCKLHVVVGPRQPVVESFVPVLADLRRVAIPPTAHWCVIQLPSPCRLQEAMAALAAQCGPLLPVAAIYLNYDGAGQRLLGIHRHTVVRPVGPFPVQGYDLVATSGAYAPLCLRLTCWSCTLPCSSRIRPPPQPPHGSVDCFTRILPDTPSPAHSPRHAAPEPVAAATLRQQSLAGRCP